MLHRVINVGDERCNAHPTRCVREELTAVFNSGNLREEALVQHWISLNVDLVDDERSGGGGHDLAEGLKSLHAESALRAAVEGDAARLHPRILPRGAGLPS